MRGNFILRRPIMLAKKILYVTDIFNLAIYQHFNSPNQGFKFMGNQVFLMKPTYEPIIALSKNLTRDELNKYIEDRMNSQDDKIIKEAFKILKKYPQLLK
jgi:hypothetical protein